MDMLATFTKVNIWAVILAGISYLILGALWYSPLLFGKQWMELNGFTEKDLKTNKPLWMITLVTFLSALLFFCDFHGTRSPFQCRVWSHHRGLHRFFLIAMSKLTSII